MSSAPHKLPWDADTTPLMLAPMQGLTNRGLRAVVADLGRPDALYTEFIRVRAGARRLLSHTDYAEAAADHGLPLVVQLIGAANDAMLDAAVMLQDVGVRHLDLNMGCPAGRMATKLSGGGWLKDSAPLSALLPRIRAAFSGSLSVKLRSGYHDPRQVFGLLPLLEDVGIDYLALHPRTVQQKYTGLADHDLTAEVVAATRLPVIANGDVRDAPTAQRVLAHTGAAGLMLGRGAIADPLLFERIRGNAPAAPSTEQRAAELTRYLSALVEQYRRLFDGDKLVLMKVKATFGAFQDPELLPWLKVLRRTSRLEDFLHSLRTGPGVLG